MNTSMSSFFVNIDLDEDDGKDVESVNLNDKVLEEQELNPKEDDSPNSLNDFDSKIETKNHSSPSNNDSISLKNEHLDRLAKQLTKDYSQYFNFSPDSQIDELNECIDNLLTHMEEFYGLVEMIRSDNTLCLDEIMDTFAPKMEQCKELFRMIDKLERIVNFVSMQVSLMEREVIKAEDMMGKKSAVKKLFSLISHSSSSSSASSSSGSNNHSYVRPDIFKTKDLLEM